MITCLMFTMDLPKFIVSNQKENHKCIKGYNANGCYSPLQQSVRIRIPLHFSFQHHLIKFSLFIHEVFSLIWCNCFLGCLFKIMLSEPIINLHLQLIYCSGKNFLYRAIHKWTSANKEDSHKNWGVKPTANLLFSILFVWHRQFKPEATYHHSANNLNQMPHTIIVQTVWIQIRPD